MNQSLLDRRPALLDGKPKQLLIDGQWVDAKSGETLPSVNPSTGRPLDPVALGGAADIDLAVDEWAREEGIADEELLSRIEQRVDEHMAAKVAQWGPDVMRYVEKTILLQSLDHLWREHLVMLDHLRQVIGLRGYGQRDPLQEYKSEAFGLYEAMTAHLREAVTAQLMRVEIVPPEEQQPVLPPMEAHKFDPNTGEDELAFANASLAPAAIADRDPKNPASWGKVGRNEDCPCGSGKKYKHCHGRYV